MTMTTADETNPSSSSSKNPKLVPLSSDAFTQPIIPRVSSSSSFATSTTTTTSTSTMMTGTTMSTSNSDSAFNINIQSPGGTPSTLTSSVSVPNLQQKKFVSFRDSSEEEEDEDDDHHDEEDHDIDIVLGHKKDINRLNVLKNKVAQSPVYFTRYLVETYPHLIQHNQQVENSLPNVRNVWKSQQYGFSNEMCGTVYNEFKAKQLFLSGSYKKSSSSSTHQNENSDNLNYCKQYYFYTPYENYILPEYNLIPNEKSKKVIDVSPVLGAATSLITQVSKLSVTLTPDSQTMESETLNYNNSITTGIKKHPEEEVSFPSSGNKGVVVGQVFPPTQQENQTTTCSLPQQQQQLPKEHQQQTPRAELAENRSSSKPIEKNSSHLNIVDAQQTALIIAVTNNQAISKDCTMEGVDKNSVTIQIVEEEKQNATAPQILIKEDDSNDIKLEVVVEQQTNCTENIQQTTEKVNTVASSTTVENNSEYQHRRVHSDSAALWTVNDISITTSDDLLGFKTPTKKITLTNNFDSADDLSSVPSTVERDTDILASNKDGDIRFMIDPSASPFMPLSPLVASSAFSPRSVPVNSSIFQEMDNGLSPISPRLLRSGSVVALDKKITNLQSPQKKKAHRRVKSFNLTHAAGVFGSEFDIKCVRVELIMLDIDTYLTKFEPIRIMSDKWIRDLDFIKFGVKIFNRIYVWLEDSLVHQFSTDKVDLSECPTIEFNLSEQPLSKVLDTTCQIINEYNTKQKYSYYNYHSFSFARRVIEKLSGKKLKSKHVLPKTLVKHYREFRDSEKKKKEKEEKEEKEHAKEEKEHAKAVSSASPATPNEAGKDGDEFDNDATPICKENLPLSASDYLDLLIDEEKSRDTNFIYYVPKRLILKKYRKFHQKQEIKNHTYLLNLINSLLEQCPKFKEEYKFDYLILKTLDRKFWLEKYLQEKYDPVKQKCKFFHKEGTRIHFEEPIYLRELLKERIHRRRKIYNVKIEDDQLSVEESPLWKNDNDNTITNFSKYREEKKGKTVKVLSMDGGGMKGLILIEILKVIEERVGKKICEIFDIVAGTSTGGIVALLINGGVPMKAAKDFYIDIGKNIFDLKTTHNKSLVKTMKVLRGRSWYDGYHLEMTSMKLTQDVDLNTLHKKKPFTFLVSTMDKTTNPKMNLDEPTAFVFRTYSDPYDYVEEGETPSSNSSKKQPSFYRGTTTGIGITAMDTIRATSAAPMYFKPRIIGDSEFIDGAVVANNPIQLSMYEAKQIFPNHDKFVFVSLGTGALSGKHNEDNGDEEVNFNLSPQGTNTKPRKKSIMKAFKGISQTLNTLLSVVNLQLSSDRIHKMATAQLEFFKEGKSLCEYFRLNVPGLGDKGLDEVDDELFALFEKDTVAYMENHPDLDRICQLLSQE